MASAESCTSVTFGVLSISQYRIEAVLPMKKPGDVIIAVVVVIASLKSRELEAAASKYSNGGKYIVFGLENEKVY
jgi:hypothetical protein